MAALAVDENQRLVRAKATKRGWADRVRTVIEGRARKVEGRELNRQGLVQFSDTDFLECGR